MGILIAGVMLFGMLGLIVINANMDPDEQTWGTHHADDEGDRTPHEYKDAA